MPIFPSNLKGAASSTKRKNTPITLASITLESIEDKSMVLVNKRGAFRAKPQEHLAKDDIRLLIDIIETSDIWPNVSNTRLELLIGKLKRMEKQ